MTRLNDPTLPGLDTALDTEAVLELLRQALPECADGLELLGGRIMDVRYHPGGPCWLLYRVRARNATNHASHQLLSAELLKANDRPSPPSEELLLRFRARQNGLVRTPMVYLPRAHMAVYAYPIDPDLPWLFDALDPSLMRAHLNRLWADRKVRVREVVTRSLGYTPRARAAFLYEVLSESRDSEVPELRRLVGKMHAKKPAPRLFAGSWALWRAANRKVSLAPPVGYIEAAGLTLQEQVRGERLGGLASLPGFFKGVKQTARMVAALHGLSLPLSTRRKPQDEAQVVHRWAGVLAVVRPDMRERVEKLRDLLASELEARTQMTGPVHGDFHHTNVLVQDDGHVVIIDLDEMAYGDPMLDVGRFLASLRIPALRAFGNLSALAEAGEAFLSEYLAKAPGDEKRVRLFEAASLLTAAASAFRIQRPTWQEEIEMLVEEAERVLGSAGCGCTPKAGNVLAAPGPVEDRNTWVKDGTYMKAALDPFIRKTYGADPVTCRVIPGPITDHGEHVRYELRGWQGELKWSAALQGIAWTRHGVKDLLRRLEALRHGIEGLPDVPLLPRPIAYLRPILLLVWDVPTGVRFSSILGTGDHLEAAAKVARSLAALHRAPIELDCVYSLDQELVILKRKVERLEVDRPDLLARALGLLEGVATLMRKIPPRVAPIVRTVHPHNVLLGERVALGKVEEVALSHPLIDAGDFLARLTILGIKRGNIQRATEAGNRFRRVYSESGAAPEEAITVFEAGALLRLASVQAKHTADALIADQLLERAAARLTSKDG